MATQIVHQDHRSAALGLAPAPEQSIMTVMERLASNPQLDAEKIEKLFNIFITGQRSMRQLEDEARFADAMADFKKNPPQILKERVAKMKGIAKGSGKEYEMQYSFADLEAYCDACMPAMAERGITWSFTHEEKAGRLHVRCILRYGLYERPSEPMSGAPDNTGAKNDLQQVGSTLSYLERYTFCAATGMVAALPDTDGKQSPAESMEPDARKARLATIQQAGNVADLKTAYDGAVRVAGKDKASVKAFEDAKNARYRELHPAAKKPEAVNA